MVMIVILDFIGIFLKSHFLVSKKVAYEWVFDSDVIPENLIRVSVSTEYRVLFAVLKSC